MSTAQSLEQPNWSALAYTALELILPWASKELGALVHALVTMIETSAMQKNELAKFILIVYEITGEVEEVANTAPAENPMSGEEKRIMAVAKVQEACKREFTTLEIPTTLINGILELVVIFRRVQPPNK